LNSTVATSNWVIVTGCAQDKFNYRIPCRVFNVSAFSFTLSNINNVDTGSLVNQDFIALLLNTPNFFFFFLTNTDTQTIIQLSNDQRNSFIVTPQPKIIIGSGYPNFTNNNIGLLSNYSVSYNGNLAITSLTFTSIVAGSASTLYSGIPIWIASNNYLIEYNMNQFDKTLRDPAVGYFSNTGGNLSVSGMSNNDFNFTQVGANTAGSVYKASSNTIVAALPYYNYPINNDVHRWTPYSSSPYTLYSGNSNSFMLNARPRFMVPKYMMVPFTTNGSSTYGGYYDLNTPFLDANRTGGDIYVSEMNREIVISNASGYTINIILFVNSQNFYF
jgi:hypothetical protein